MWNSWGCVFFLVVKFVVSILAINIYSVLKGNGYKSFSNNISFSDVTTILLQKKRGVTSFFFPLGHLLEVTILGFCRKSWDQKPLEVWNGGFRLNRGYENCLTPPQKSWRLWLEDTIWSFWSDLFHWKLRDGNPQMWPKDLIVDHMISWNQLLGRSMSAVYVAGILGAWKCLRPCTESSKTIGAPPKKW